MNKRVKWFVLLWHDWRCAVWHARENRAKTMCSFHEGVCGRLRADLFALPPAPPPSIDPMFEKYRGK